MQALKWRKQIVSHCRIETRAILACTEALSVTGLLHLSVVGLLI